MCCLKHMKYTHKNKTVASCSLQIYPDFSNNFLRNYSSKQNNKTSNRDLTRNCSRPLHRVCTKISEVCLPSHLTVDFVCLSLVFFSLVISQVAVVTQKRNIASGWQKAVKVMPPSGKECMSHLPWGRKGRNTSRETGVMQSTLLGMILAFLAPFASETDSAYKCWMTTFAKLITDKRQGVNPKLKILTLTSYQTR